MLTWQELVPQLKQTVNTIIRFVKARRREEAAIAMAAIFLWLGYYSISFIERFPKETLEFVKYWKGHLIIPALFFLAGLAFLAYGIYRIWRLVYVPDLPLPANRPSAIKGPLAFTPADGELFRKLGREDELRKLLGYVQDDQVRLVVLMGASGAGKTSLLRAGLTDILKDTDIHYHYWEAKPTDSWQGLLSAVQQSWQAEANSEGDHHHPAPELKSLDELVNPAPEFGQHVIVLDQFEQLGASVNSKIFQLLRKVARNARPPHRVTWVIAFRREYRASWSDFIIPE
ncbi:MAG: AAA family ATPase [Pyrinomonadaceae bacterium]|nr:AAA family ATPase [Pyrinomonadaceae bacterium]